MRSPQNLRAAARPIIAAISSLIRKHRAVANVSLSGLAILAALALSFQGAAAGPTPEKVRPASILPVNIGIGVSTTGSVAVHFPAPMDRQSVVDALSVTPTTAWRTAWSADGSTMRLVPERRWMTDRRYVVRVGAGARRANGAPIGSALNLSFTTETAPTVADFQLFYVAETAGDRARAVMEADVDEASSLQATEAPPDTASDVSAATRITVAFSTGMNQADVARRFAIRPYVPGKLSWEGNALIFEPRQRLVDGARYTVSVVGAHDVRGNRLAGDVSFSFTTRPGAQVVTTAPKPGANDVTDGVIRVRFSQPMDIAATSAALTVTDATSGAEVAGSRQWNTAATQVTFTPSAALARGHSFKIVLSDGARDQDHNPVSGSWSFRTKAVAVAAAPAPAAVSRPAGPPPPSDIQQYALWQINQSRAAYGFAPLRLDAAITQVASAHAWDMINYGYFSHTGRDGSRVSDRLRRAGISFSSSGENICYNTGLGVKETLNWCHSVFMSEPYPGYPNHIGNILSPNFSRVGIGIAQSGGRIKIVWDFAG